VRLVVDDHITATSSTVKVPTLDKLVNFMPLFFLAEFGNAVGRGNYGLTDFLYQRDREIIAFVRADLVL
jgi:hypothetical protein